MIHEASLLIFNLIPKVVIKHEFSRKKADDAFIA